MKYFLVIHFLLFLSILNIKCEKKLLKAKECSYSEKIVRLDRCEVVDGKSFLVFEVLKPIEKCMVSKYLKNPIFLQKCALFTLHQ